MGFFGKYWKIDGVTAALITRGSQNGRYQILFERENASLEQIEGINWAKPTIEKLTDRNELGLPEGYGFEVVNITYANNTRSYTVTVQTAQQYLGDVTEYQAQVTELQAQVTDLAGQVAAAQSRTAAAEQAAAAKETELAEAYEEGVESNG